VGVLGVVGLAASGMITTKHHPAPLPGTTTADLLADVQTATVPGLSGTIVAQLSLGLPSLPGASDSDGDASMAGLLSGSHTVRLWYGGPDRQRLAVLGTTSETDVFHLAQDVWHWDSATHVATHMVLPQRSAASPRPLPTSTESLNPQQLADQLLAAIEPTTRVTLGKNRVVADRSAYELVLAPRDSASRVGSVHIAVDGLTKVALGVQVYPRGTDTAAIDVAFSSVTFKTPSAGYFAFTPPPGATVHEKKVSGGGGRSDEVSPLHSGSGGLTTIGSGWTSIVEYRATPKQIASSVGPALRSLKPVSGSWGSGRLLDSPLLTVLVTDDGRVFAGAVDPQSLYAAASTHK
jgi:outer membrane lipoprotein-sorting protein